MRRKRRWRRKRRLAIVVLFVNGDRMLNLLLCSVSQEFDTGFLVLTGEPLSAQLTPPLPPTASEAGLAASGKTSSGPSFRLTCSALLSA